MPFFLLIGSLHFLPDRRPHEFFETWLVMEEARNRNTLSAVPLLASAQILPQRKQFSTTKDS